MTTTEESSLFSLGGGCSVHGDEQMLECGMCGCEFCRACHPRATVCPACAKDREDEEEEEDPDFYDVKDLNKLIGVDREAERILRDAEEDPPAKSRKRKSR